MHLDLIKSRLIEDLELSELQVNNVIEMLDNGDTIPFIARYRKEKTNSMTDEVLRTFDEKYHYYLNFYDRLDTIVKSIQDQGLYSDEIDHALFNAKTLSELEDIYRPYKPKKKTRASIAKAKGLEPLADYIQKQIYEYDFDTYVSSFINEEKGVLTNDEALKGAKDIIAERISDDANFRKFIRNNTFKKGLIVSSKNKDEEGKIVFDQYYDYQEKINKIPAHRVLAINRGEKLWVLKVSISDPIEENLSYLERKIIKNNSPFVEILKETIQDSYSRLIKPSIENEIRNDLTETSENSSIEVFKLNLKELLLESPIKNKVVLGFDPGFRTGCKLGIVNENGVVLYTGVCHVTLGSEELFNKEADRLYYLIKKYKVNLISLGNGTASRESEMFINKHLFGRYDDLKQTVDYIITNEAGASVYSASKLGIKEFPNLDVSVRSAISLARRVQDPLCELVKIDPKSIGVGQYQHDMNQKHLSEALGGVVENCVNQVGVEVNNASPSLLNYVAGINSSIAENIVKCKEENGPFKSRKELLNVPKLGKKAFEQCAGFLRISDGYILDRTGIHPESYDVALKLLKICELDVNCIGTNEIAEKLNHIDLEKIAKELNVGLETLQDIKDELVKPGRDIRDLNQKAILRNDVTDITNLKVGMVLDGTVRNIIDFGAFVDIGVHQDGLIHISQLSNGYVKHPLDIVKIGQIVKVKVISVDVDKKKIGLSMKEVNK